MEPGADALRSDLRQLVRECLAWPEALEAAEVVFRVAHQPHGAMGFGDETRLSRHGQPARRLPLGLSATRAALTTRLG